jgi:hypothetical protein
MNGITKVKIHIDDAEISNLFCIVIFIPKTPLLFKIHVNSDNKETPRAVIHNTYKGGASTVDETRPVLFEIKVKKKCIMFEANVPTILLSLFDKEEEEDEQKEKKILCIDLFENDSQEMPCHKRRYACCNIIEFREWYAFQDFTLKDGTVKTYGQCAVLNGGAPIKRATIEFKEYKEMFTKIEAEYRKQHPSTSQKYLEDALKHQFYSPLTQSTRVIGNIMVPDFIDRVQIPKITQSAFEKLFAGADKNETARLNRIVTWVREYFKWLPDKHHEDMTNSYTGGFIQDALNCKDLALTIFQIVMAAKRRHNNKYFPKEARIVLVGGLVGATNEPHMIAVYHPPGKRGIVLDATDRHDIIEEYTPRMHVVLSEYGTKGEAFWIKKEEQVYGAYLSDYLDNNSIIKEHKYSEFFDSLTIERHFIMKEKMKQCLDELYAFEQPLLKVEKFPPPSSGSII